MCIQNPVEHLWWSFFWKILKDVYRKRCSWKFCRVHGKHLCCRLLLIKLQDFKFTTLWKSNSGAGFLKFCVLLWVLRNFWKYLFCSISGNGCFCDPWIKKNLKVLDEITHQKFSLLYFGSALSSFIQHNPALYEVLWDHFMLQSFTGYLRLTLGFMWNSALREKFDFCFSRDFG